MTLRSPIESQQTQTFSVDHENVLPEHYRLIELIGRGGMAEVYLAEDRRLGRKVAIKFLNPEFRRDPDRVRRFRQEARSASALNHPNILIIHDISDRGGVQFILSEFVEGETLGTRIAQGRVPFTEAVDIAVQAASALTAAHAAGIVHRDIKPDNVMIRNDGVVKVLDFGLAKARGFTTLNGGDFDALTLDSGSTSPGLIVGTPQYMSPEQARGKELDGRTDIFSLGIIIFEMVTRHSPFASGSFADTMAAILTKEPRQMEEFVDDAPQRLIDLIAKCLKKDPNERFSSMAEVETELRLLRSELIAHPRDTAEVDPARSDRTQIRPTDQHSIRKFVSNTFQRPSPIAAVIILVAASLLVGGWWAWDRVTIRSTTPSLMRTVPITSWSSSASELVTSASFSPDGKMIAFAARKGDATEIWVKPVVGGDPVQVTRTGGYNQFPVWSDDGQEIAFISNRGNSLGFWRVPFTGGDMSKILGAVEPTARPMFWSKDRTLYFQSNRQLLKVSESVEPLAVTDLAEFGSNIRTIEISHDERSIAYSIKQDSGWKLMTRAIPGGTDRELAHTQEQIDYIAWHPDGQSIFCSFLVEGSLHVFEVPLDGSGAIQRSNGDTNFIVHDVAANGSVLYGTLAETSDLWRVDTRSNQESIVANEVASEFWPAVSDAGAIAYQSVARLEQPDSGSIRVRAANESEATKPTPDGFLPSWSNSGEWIAFFRKGAEGPEVWKSRPNGIDLARISKVHAAIPQFFMAPYLTTVASHISWSRDDTQVAFAARVDDDSGIWVSASDGSMSGRLLKAPGGVAVGPLWTPNSGSILYISFSGRSSQSADRVNRIVTSEIATGDTRVLFESKEPIRILGFPDAGRSIMFAKNNSKSVVDPVPHTTEIYSLGLSSGAAQMIAVLNNAYFRNLHLSDDGRWIGFVTRKGDRTAIATLEIGKGVPREHVVVNDPKVLISSLGLSRDGSFIVFGKQTRTNLLSMLTN